MASAEEAAVPVRTPVVRIALEGTLAAPAQARAAVRQALRMSGHSSLIADACLLVSELTTNAVLHARSPVEVTVLSLPYGIRIEVRDQDGTAAPERRPMEIDSDHGRGLLLVEALTAAWGCVPDGAGGKVVWFEMRHG